MKDARENSSRVSKEWENSRISYTISTLARFLARRLGHLLVNPERLEKGYKRIVRGGNERVVLEKSPACNYFPDFLLLAESSPQGCSRVLVYLILLFSSSFIASSSPTPPPPPVFFVYVTIYRRLQVQVAIRQGFI